MPYSIGNEQQARSSGLHEGACQVILQCEHMRVAHFGESCRGCCSLKWYDATQVSYSLSTTVCLASCLFSVVYNHASLSKVLSDTDACSNMRSQTQPGLPAACLVLDGALLPRLHCTTKDTA